MSTDDKEAKRDVADAAPATVEAEPAEEFSEPAPEDAVSDGEEASSGGHFGLAAFVVLAFAGLAAYAALPYWRGYVPDPYRSYLPDLPQSETRTLIGGLEDSVAANRAELARLQAEVKTLRGEVEEFADAVSPEAAPARGEIAALKERMAGLEARLRVLGAGSSAAAGSSPAPASAAAADLSYRMDLLAGGIERQAEATRALAAKEDQRLQQQRDALTELARRLDAVESSRAEATSVLRLSDRINDVENLARTMASRHDASLANLLAVVQLRAKAADGLPFDAEIRTARALAEDKDAFDALAGGFVAQAGTGVATTVSLRRGFDTLSAAAARAAAAPQGESILDKTIGRVTGLVTVRRIDGKEEGRTTTAILARAETFIDAGDLAGAVKELKAIEAPGVTAALKPWIERAEARIALDAALSTLTADALARVAAGAAQAPVPTSKKGG
jgi:uroporphyrinogen-III synthase